MPIRLTREIGRALAAAHDAQVVHRDLKPDNVMVVANPNEPEVVKVLDFGIAKAIEDPARPADLSADAGANVTAAGTIVGTPRYMSPEQFLGTRVDARTDIYALALIAYEMVSGVSPFDAKSAAGWATAHVAVEARPFDATPGGAMVPFAIRDVLLRALAKRPEERPATVRDFLGALAEAAGVVVGSLPTRPLAAPVPSSNLALAPTEDDLAAAPQAASNRRSSGRFLVAMAALAIALGVASVAMVLVYRGRQAEHGSPVDTATSHACERVVRAKTCAEATAALQECPESEGHAHEHAHVYRDSLCGE